MANGEIDLGNGVVRTKGDSATMYAGFFTAEVADVSSSDFTVTIDGGVAKGLYISADGDVKVDTPNGETITYKTMAAGFHPLPHTKIYTSGTSVGDKATGIVSGSW
jgi:hypothetical protein